MADFLLTDNALKRVRYYNVDLDIDLLWMEEDEVLQKGLQADVARVRSALVARIADIIKQNSSQPSALDTAVVMAEVLLSSYTTGSQQNKCHKYVIQAISLLASSEKRFSAAVDLFFDLVDRYIALNHTSAVVDVCILRTMQTYDQTFVKIFLSKPWACNGLFEVENPLWRIKCIRREFGSWQDQRILARMRMLGGRRVHSPVFGDSVKILQSMHRRRPTSPFVGRVSGSRHTFHGLVHVVGMKRKDSVTTTEDSSSGSTEQEIGMAIG